MPQINYSLIGTHPEVERYADDVHTVIAEWRGNNKTRMVTGVILELLAEHVYGLDADEFDSITDLIDGIEGLEQHTKYH